MKIKISDDLAFVVAVSSTVIPGVMSTSMLSLAFGDIATSFGISYQILQWRNVLFFGVFSISILYFSAMVPRYGAKRALVAAQILFVISAIVAALTSNWLIFLIAQTGQAAADGIMVPSQMSFIRSRIPEEKWGWAFGWFHGTLAVATLIGPLFGAFLIAQLGWQSIPAGLAILQVIILLVSLRLPSQATSGSPDQRPPVLSALILFAGLCFLQSRLPELADSGALAGSWFSVGGGCVLAAFFILNEWRLGIKKRQTLVPWHSLKNIPFALSLFRIFLVFVVSNAAALHLPAALRTISSISVGEIGIVLTGTALLSVLLEPILGRMADRWEHGALISGLIMMTITTSFYFLLGPLGALITLAIASLGGAVASALFSPAQLRIATLATDKSERDHFMGFYMFCQFISGAFAASILGRIIEDTATGSISHASFQAYIKICVLMLVMATLSGIISAVGSRHK